jgi:hypothetical protein
MGCTEAAKWPERLAKDIISQVRQLEKLENVSALMKLCVQQ